MTGTIKVSQIPAAAANPLATDSVLGIHSSADVLFSIAQIASATGISAIISVKDYGAVGNGIADDTAAIQAAITAATTGGGIVFFPAGIYAVSAKLSVSSNTYLIGSGPGGTTIKLTSSLADELIAAASATDWGVSSLTIDVNNNITGLHGAITASLSTNTIVNNVEIKHITTFGVNFNGMTRFRITGCTISKDTKSTSQNEAILVGVSAGASSNGFINGNILINSGMEISAIDTEISGNFINGFSFGGGITIDQSVSSARYLITRNIITGGTGTDVNNTICLGIEQWAPNSVVSHNICYSNAGVGISAGGQNGVYNNNSCFDNCISFASAAGIFANYGTATYNASNSIFVGNQSYNTNGAAGTQTYGYKETGTNGQQPGIILKGNNFNTNATGPTLIVNTTTINDWPNILTYTPTVTPSAGAITSVNAAGSYQVFGDGVYFTVTINIPTNGTGSGFINATLPPITPNALAAVEWSVNGYCPNSNFVLGGFFIANGTTFSVHNYDGSYPGANGFTLNVSGFYYS